MIPLSRFLNINNLRRIIGSELRGFDIKYIIDLLKLTVYIDNRSKYYSVLSKYSDSISNPYKGERRVIYMNDWGKKAGMADMLKGVLTVYGLSKKYNRPFYIFWDNPFPLDDYLAPASFNWKIKEKEIFYSKKGCFPVFFTKKKNQTLFQTKVKRLVFKNLFSRKRELHVNINYLLSENNYPELFKELFKPTELIEKELKKYSDITNYYSYTFRFQRLLGDFIERNGYELDMQEREKLIEKNLLELKKLLKELPQGYRALVTSDSITFLERAREIDERIFIIPGRIYHPSAFWKENDENKKYPFLKSFIDFFMIMGAKKVYRLSTGNMYPSGFPKLAAQLGGSTFKIHNF